MSLSMEQVKEAALRLPFSDRARILDALLDSLPDATVERIMSSADGRSREWVRECIAVSDTSQPRAEQ